MSKFAVVTYWWCLQDSNRVGWTSFMRWDMAPFLSFTTLGGLEWDHLPSSTGFFSSFLNWSVLTCYVCLLRILFKTSTRMRMKALVTVQGTCHFFNIPTKNFLYSTRLWISSYVAHMLIFELNNRWTFSPLTKESLLTVSSNLILKHHSIITLVVSHSSPRFYRH